MRKFFVTVLMGILLGVAWNWQLAGATSLKHDWRQYFTLDNNSLAGAEVIKMHISPTGYTYVLLKITFWDFPYYILEFDNLGNLINKVSANYTGPCWIYSYCDMALDKQGRIYLLGSFTNEAYITRSFLQTYGDDFKLLSCFVFAEGEASGLCLGEMGEVYVVGVNPSQSHFVAMLGKRGFAVAKSVTPANSNQMNFVEPVWLTFLPDDTGWANGKIILDKSGNLYAGGSCDRSWGEPLRPYLGEYDTFVAKLDGNGHLIWNTFLGGNDDDCFKGLAIFSGSGSNDDDFSSVTLAEQDQGKIGVIGWSEGPWGNPVRPWRGNYSEYSYVAQLDLSGQLLWNTFLGNGEYDLPGGIVMDEQGNSYLTGLTYYFGWGSPLWEYKCRGVENGSYIAKIDDQGCLLWHAFLPPKRPAKFRDDFVNASTVGLWQGSIFITGICGSTEAIFERDGYGFLDKITEKK